MSKRPTAIRNQHRREIAKAKPHCAICQQPIDFNLRFPDPMCYVVDHIVPIALGGHDTLSNKQATHRICNSRKSDTMPMVEFDSGVQWS